MIKIDFRYVLRELPVFVTIEKKTRQIDLVMQFFVDDFCNLTNFSSEMLLTLGSFVEFLGLFSSFPFPWFE